MLSRVADTAMASELGGVSIQDYFVHAWLPRTNLVVGEALVGVEIDDEDESGALKDNHLVILMFPGYVSRMGTQPTVPEKFKVTGTIADIAVVNLLCFSPVQGGIELVQEPIS